MRTELLDKLIDLRHEIAMAKENVESAQDGLDKAEKELANFCADNKAELAELRSQIPGEAKPKRTRADAGKLRGPRKKPELVPVEGEAA